VAAAYRKDVMRTVFILFGVGFGITATLSALDLVMTIVETQSDYILINRSATVGTCVVAVALIYFARWIGSSPEPKKAFA
jgi:FtsH-binding integral membrane protein